MLKSKFLGLDPEVTEKGFHVQSLALALFAGNGAIQRGRPQPGAPTHSVDPPSIDRTLTGEIFPPGRWPSCILAPSTESGSHPTSSW